MFNERPLGPGGDQLAREICADLMELHFDTDVGAVDHHDIRELQTKARSLLTGEKLQYKGREIEAEEKAERNAERMRTAPAKPKTGLES